jgi:Spy/CpxP family protein refolding chaperone
MSYFTRKNIITALVIILIVINVVTLATFIFRPHFVFHRENKCNTECDNPRDFLKKELNLTEEQSAKFEQMRKAHSDTLSVLAREMHKKRNELTMEMMKVKPDTLLLFNTTDEIGDIYAAIRKLNIIHYWELKSLCNDTQKQKLDSVFKGVFCCDEGMFKCYGPRSEKNECMREKHKGCKFKQESQNSIY